MKPIEIKGAYIKGSQSAAGKWDVVLHLDDGTQIVYATKGKNEALSTKDDIQQNLPRWVRKKMFGGWEISEDA